MIRTVHRAPAPHASLVTAERYVAAPAFSDYMNATVKNHDWWESTYRVAKAGDEYVARAQALASSWRLLALSEDWCGDAVNCLPFIARLADAAPRTLELRVLQRDTNPDIMNAHLTRKSRSIPIVVALDANFLEHGWWGPRPLDLQKLAVGEWRELPKDDRRLRIRTWYARDQGRQILTELLDLLEPPNQTI